MLHVAKAIATKPSPCHGVNQHQKIAGFSPKKRQQFSLKLYVFVFKSYYRIFLNQELENIGY